MRYTLRGIPPPGGTQRVSASLEAPSGDPSPDHAGDDASTRRGGAQTWLDLLRGAINLERLFRS
jgi:hypothetical protein